jgi:cytochrome c oxidase subunit I
MGQPRRMAFYDYQDQAIAPQAPYVAISCVGGFIILVSALLLLVNLLLTHFQPKTLSEDRIQFSLAVNPPTRVPRVLNGFAFWNALLFVLLAVNYGLPLSQFLFFKQNPTPAFSVGVTEYKEK